MKFLLSNIDWVILIIVAIFLFFNLKKIIGTRIGYFKSNTPKNLENLQQPKEDTPKTTKDVLDVKAKSLEDKEKPKNINLLENQTNENVSAGLFNNNLESKLQIYPEGSLMDTLQKIYLKASSFDVNTFLEQQKETFTAIVVNFNIGNIDSIKQLLSTKVLNIFSTAIADVNFVAKNIKVQQFLSVNYYSASIDEQQANISIKFTTVQLIDNKEYIINEIWTFTNSFSNLSVWVLDKIKVV